MSVEAIILTDDSADHASGLMQYILSSNAFYLPPPAICKERQAGDGGWVGEEFRLGYIVRVT